MMALSLLGLALVALVAWAVRFPHRSAIPLAKKTAKTKYPELVSVAILAVQASELVNVVEHANLVNIVAALLIMTLLLAVRSGTEGELH